MIFLKDGFPIVRRSTSETKLGVIISPNYAYSEQKWVEGRLKKIVKVSHTFLLYIKLAELLKI